jgi:hypothetical protein
MKKNIFRATFSSLFILFTCFSFGQQEIEREYVQVLNIEMLVRVMKNGRPVAGLKKGDFALMENGHKQDINGFLEVHRSIAPGEIVPAIGTEKQKRPGRLFLLFFWINESVVKVDEVLDYFFKSIYREGDRVILADQRRSLEINNAADIENKLGEFKAGLVALSRDMQVARSRLSMDVESYLQEYLECLKLKRKGGENVINPKCRPDVVVIHYEQLMKEYLLQNQKPSVNRLEVMARNLEAVEVDKWALIFFQHDSLPLFDTEKMKLGDNQYHLGDVLDMIEKVNRDLLFPTQTLVLADSLRTRFIQANTQFHLLLLGSRQAPSSLEAVSRFNIINPFPVISNWEETFRQMAAATGGEVMDGNRMKEALAEVANREDVYYVITYAPSEGKSPKRRVDINVDRDGVKVIHGRRVEMENLPGIKLAAIEEIPGKVRLALENFYMIGQGEQRSGLVRVSLSADGGDGKPQILAKDVEFPTTGSVEIPVALPPGKYKLSAQVVDSLTGREAKGESTLDVLGGEVPAETAALLRLAAGYSERLRNAAFRFICKETVSEDVLVRDTIDRSSYKRARTSWLYEYQVLVREGKVTEDRVLLRKNKTKKRVEDATLETRFRSLYSVFLPATLFAADKQPSYFYRLERHEKMFGRQVARVVIAPRPGFEELGAGTAWVDEETGAVLKIELAQRAIKGIEAAEKRARQAGARLLVSDVHEYDVERDGIWLPGSTTISEYYVINVVAVKESQGYLNWNEAPETPPPAKYASSSGGSRQIELSRTWVEYSDFQFFVVDVQVKEGR